MKIEKHIVELLRNYDCVIIPGLGGFVANYAPSQYNPAKGIMLPPCKAIIFNRNLINNDGLLVNHISVHETVSYQDALTLVNSFTNECKKNLVAGKRIEFDELGVLYEDNEQTIQFRPDFSVNFLTESFGLTPVIAKEIVQSVIKPEPAVVKVVKEEIPVVEKKEEKIERELKQEIRTVETVQKESVKVVPIKTKRKTGRYILAAAVAIPVIFYSVWIPLKTDVMDTGVIEVADLNPFNSHEKPVAVYKTIGRTSEKVKVEMPSVDEMMNEDPIIDVPIISEVDTTLVEHSDAVELNTSSGMNYHVITGCFLEEDNANRMVEYLKSKGYNAYILDTVNGLKRVAAASFDNVGDAVNSLREIRNGNISEAWVLNKN